jgi:hypothetical protein
MDLGPIVEQLRRELLIAAAAGGDEAQALAERLLAPLESSVRLALLSALSAAAEELTAQLAPTSVDLRMRGGDMGFVAVPAPTAAGAPSSAPPVGGPAEEPPGPAPATEADDAATARLTLRLPDSLKSRVEDAAGRAGVSVNTWVVRALGGAVDAPGRSPDSRRGRDLGQRFTGWAR